MAAVDCESVSKTFPDGTRALSDCSLTIADGELLVLVGPSGCGKSTLLRMVAGLETISEGTIRIGGKVANDLSPRDRNVAMVFQDYALYPHMTVRRNLEYPLRMRGMKRDDIRRRVEEVASLLEIGALMDRLPRELSGGQRQRVAMGRALVREPAVFLLDEPLSNLDAKLRQEVRGEIAALQHRTRTTMIYVTHDQTEAMTLGDRVAVLDRGVLQQVAPPRELYERPANVFVARFIGTPAMNVFRSRVQRADRGFALSLGPQSLRIEPDLQLRRALEPFLDQEISIGVRPEHVVLAPPGRNGSIDAAVEHVEPLGHETLARLDASGEKLFMRLGGMPPLETGKRVRVVVEPSALHFFDADGHALR
jgi:multiple sugar transport system ATP-binding protein